jgi:hypothetical protein
LSCITDDPDVHCEQFSNNWLMKFRRIALITLATTRTLPHGRKRLCIAVHSSG